jgi:hypothetical protein
MDARAHVVASEQLYCFGWIVVTHRILRPVNDSAARFLESWRDFSGLARLFLGW